MAKSWPNVYKQGNGWIVDCGLANGKRVRVYRSTKTKADQEASMFREQRRLEEIGVRDLAPADRLDAARALVLLDGTGISLEELARKAVRSGDKNDILIDDLWEEYLARKQASGLRHKSIISLKSREGQFARDFSGSYLSAIRDHMIETWLDKKKSSPVTWNADLRGVKTLLNYAVKRRYIDRSPAAGVDFVRVRMGPPSVFSVEQAEDVLLWCINKKPEMVPYYALALFGGLRPDEIKRVPSRQINLPDRIITLTDADTKTRMRHVKIQRNLAVWLGRFPVETDRVFWKRYWHDKLVGDLGYGSWPNDVCRKSFISYHLAAFRNLADTVQEAGHRDSKMIFTNYRNTQTLTKEQITSDYSKAYWRITPASVLKKKEK